MPLFYFSGRRRLRYLRSFPTRRSSDLELVDAGGVDEQGGDGAVLPGGEAFLDAVLGADEGDGVDELVGDHGDGLVGADSGEMLLDHARLFLVAEPRHDLGVLVRPWRSCRCFIFPDVAASAICALSLHDALPISSLSMPGE